MNLVIEVKTLLEKLNVAFPALNDKDADPIASHYLFRVGSDFLEILGGHSSSGLCSYQRVSDLPPTNVDEDETVDFTVDGVKGRGFLKSLSGGSIHITYDSDMSEVVFSPDSLKAEIRMKSLNPQDSYNFEADFKRALSSEETGSFEPHAFAEALGVTLPFIGKNTAQAGHSLLHLETRDGKGCVCAANGRAISILRHSNISGAFDIRGEKAGSLNEFLRVSTGKITVREGVSNVFLVEEVSGNFFGFRKVDYRFPDSLWKLDPFAEDLPTIFKIDREALRKAVSRMQWTLDSTQKRLGIELVGDEGDMNSSLRLFTRNTKGTTSEDTLEDGVQRVKGSDPVTIYVKIDSLLRALDKMPGDTVSGYIMKSRSFSVIKFMASEDDDDATVEQSIILSLMKPPRS